MSHTAPNESITRRKKSCRLEYVSRAIFTGFSFLWRQPAKIHISNVRRRIRETMSTKPRDSSKMISGGSSPPSYHAARHTERNNIPSAFVGARARARVRSVTLKFVVFLKQAASSCFTRWFRPGSPFFFSETRKEKRKEETLLIVAVGRWKEAQNRARRRRCTGCFRSGDIQ